MMSERVFEAMQKAGVIVRPMGGYQLPEWIHISHALKNTSQGDADGYDQANQEILPTVKQHVSFEFLMLDCKA